MKRNLFIHILFMLTLALVYLAISYLLGENGYYHLEAYFIEYKIEQLFRIDISFYSTFYFTEPALLFLGSLMLSWIPYFQSTFILNALVMGGLITFIFQKSQKYKSNSWWLWMYLLISPVMWFAATGGGRFALYLTFYFFFFLLILGYIRQYSVFHLASLSILLGIFLLLDISLLKLLILLIPIFFFIAFYKAKGIRGNFYSKASRIFGNDSQRRKFFTGFFSTILLAAFIPLTGFGSYHVINRIFGGGAFYYQTSIADSWNSYSGKFPLELINSLDWEFISEGNLLFLLLILCIGTGLLNLLPWKGKSTSFPIIAFLALGYVISEAADNKILNLNLQLLGLLSGAGLASLVYIPVENITGARKISSVLVVVLILVLEFMYFQNSVYSPETRFLRAVLQTEEQSPELTSIQSVQGFFEKKGKTRVLADDVIFYPHLSDLPESILWVGHFSPNFQHSLQEPGIYADYLIITPEDHPLHLNDVVAAALDRLDYHGIPLRTKIVYEDNLAIILELMD